MKILNVHFTAFHEVRPAKSTVSAASECSSSLVKEESQVLSIFVSLLTSVSFSYLHTMQRFVLIRAIPFHLPPPAYLSAKGFTLSISRLKVTLFYVWSVVSVCMSVPKYKLHSSNHDKQSVCSPLLCSQHHTTLLLRGQENLLVERWNCDWKVASLNPGRGSRRIFFSRVNFVSWLLFSVHSTPCYCSGM